VPWWPRSSASALPEARRPRGRPPSSKRRRAAPRRARCRRGGAWVRMGRDGRGLLRRSLAAAELHRERQVWPPGHFRRGGQPDRSLQRNQAQPIGESLEVMMKTTRQIAVFNEARIKIVEASVPSEHHPDPKIVVLGDTPERAVPPPRRGRCPDSSARPCGWRTSSHASGPRNAA
jgi:hypothetical protein